MSATSSAGTLAQDRCVLLDVSRLIWRAWRRGLPTGIDRVCLAYLEHFHGRAQAVVQRKGARFVLSPCASDRLFRLILRARTATRLDWLKLATALLPSVLRSKTPRRAIYLNVGHTGLDETSLPDWIASNGLLAVFMIHDLIPLTHPQFCRAGEAAKHQRRVENMLASASGIIGNSAATLAELGKFAAAQGRPMPPGIAVLIAGHHPPAVVSPPKIDRPYFVTVGTIEGRKNHILLLQVWQRLVGDLGAAAPSLVIIGQRGWEANAAIGKLDELAELTHHIIEMNNCEDDELAGLISGSRAVLMPSVVEGFGLPVVEALQLSVPVIATDLPVYRELAGSIPTYLDGQDVGQWASTVLEFLDDCPERQRQLAAMPAYCAPSWPEHFGQVETWLQTIA